MYRSLTDFLRRLEAEGELVRIGVPVDPVEEIAEITERMARQPGGGKALLFENTGTEFPVATNMFGSERRMAAALGVRDLSETVERIEALTAGALSSPSGLADRLRALSLVGKAAAWLPRRARGRGECQQVAMTGKDADLGVLPALKCREHDGGRFVTLPIVNTVDARTGARNAGMYRMQIMGRDTAALHWHIHKTGARHYESWRRRGGMMPVSVCVGGDPAYTYAATAPLPEGVDEYLFAGFLRGRGVKLVKCLTNELWVPADCDFVLEGFVDPAGDKVAEGPFADHTGFYSLEDFYPEFRVTAVTHRRGAVWPATVVGIPPQEDYYIAQATERIFLPLIRTALAPEVEDLYMPSYGTAHNLALAAVRRSYPGQAHKAASVLWGAGQMMFNKFLLLCDAGTDLRNPYEIARLLRGADVSRAVIRGDGVLDVLDHAAATPCFGGKLALDLTAPVRPSGESVEPGLPEAALPPGCVTDMSLAPRWAVELIYADPGETLAPQAAAAAAGRGVKYVVLADSEARGLTEGELLWLACANTDPSRDVTSCGDRLVIDARTKLPGKAGFPRRFPNPAVSSVRITELVDRRWPEYGLGEFVSSPSLRYRPLVRSNKADI